MGKSAKFTRAANFSTHKKNVKRRTLVVEKRGKHDKYLSAATGAASAKAPREAKRDAPPPKKKSG